MNTKGQQSMWIIFGLIVFIGLLVLLLGYDTVEPSHMGVKVKFGNIIGPMNPGMQWTGVFTHVEQYDMRIRKDVIELKCVKDDITKILDCSSAAATKQGQAVYSTINVNYRIKNNQDVVMNLYRNVGTNDQIDDKLNIKAIIMEGFKQTTVKYDWIGILENREAVKLEAIEAIKTNFPTEYLEIQDVVITNIGFSPEFQSELEAKQIAEQTGLKEKNNLEVIKFQQQQEIEKYKAEAEKLRLQKNEITSLLNQQAWISKWDGKLPTYMIASTDTMTNLLQLPVSAVSNAGGQ
jgi:regulator of protease activity HflC (stomatin/prohibitin superfamily)